MKKYWAGEIAQWLGAHTTLEKDQNFYCITQTWCFSSRSSKKPDTTAICGHLHACFHTPT